MALPTLTTDNEPQSPDEPYRVLEAGVDFTRLRSFLPKETSDESGSQSDFKFSLSVGDTPVESKSLAPTTFRSAPSNADNILTESELQCKTLFAFIEKCISSINDQLDKRGDWPGRVSPNSTTASANRLAEMGKNDLEANIQFCDRTLTRVKELRNCLMVSLTHLYSILDRAFPDDRHSVLAKFRDAKSQSINQLIGQLEQCQNAVQDLRKYLEALLNVVSWDELIKPQHQSFTIFLLVHFIIFLLSVAALVWYAGYKDRYIGLFYLYRGPMFVTLYFYLYGVTLVGWATTKIKYVDIFRFSGAEETPTPYVIFNIAGILSFTFTVFVALLMITVRLEDSEIEKSETEQREIPERILPLLLWIIIAAVLLNPFRYLMRQGRWDVVKMIGRILLAPFYRIRFGDFWFADQLVSIVVILLDIEFMLCFYSYVWPFDKNEDGRVCNKNTYIVRPVITCLPAFCRLMQCLRSYYDDTEHYSHLINAGKYFTTFPVVILFTLYAVDHKSLTERLVENVRDDGILGAWVVVSFVNAMYTFTWDVYMDWGLFQSRNLLRPKLGYSWKSLYYVAIVEDFILRFAWSLKLSLGLHLEAKVNLFYSLLAGLEIFRRFVWNFYRVEYEMILKSDIQPSRIEDGDDTTQPPSNDNSSDESDINEEVSLLRQHSINKTT